MVVKSRMIVSDVVAQFDNVMAVYRYTNVVGDTRYSIEFPYDIGCTQKLPFASNLTLIYSPQAGWQP